MRAEVVSVACAVQSNNVLRYDCAVTLSEPDAAVLDVWRADSTEPRSFTSDDAALDHVVTVYGLHAGTTYEWQSGEMTGELTTGPLPAGLDLELSVTNPDAATTGHVAFAWGGCADDHYMVIASTAGEVVWYEDLGASRASGYNVGETNNLLVIQDRERAFEYRLDGSSVELETEAESGTYMHHDLYERGGNKYALFAQAVDYDDGETYIMDGVRTFDADGALVDEWDMRNALDPRGTAREVPAGYWRNELGDAFDYSHANAVWVTDTGDWYISMRNLSTVAKVVDGDIEWLMVGDEAESSLTGDFVFESSVTGELGFAYQHHINVHEDGMFTLFDNGTQPGDARAIAMRVDESSGVAEIVTEYPMDQTCPAQGSAYLLDSGNMFATCAAERTFREVPPGASAAWTMTVDCRDGSFTGSIYRGVPIELEL
jgi:hypothetical protein